MDIQVLNEIANPARQASLSQVRASASANAQLKALKGNAVPAPGNPVPPPFEDSPVQTQDPVTPEISSVARAASAYSAAVGDGLNSDELSAIQDLAGRVRTAVSDFLSQPGLEQAENAATVVASNPEAIQNLTASVEQAVVAAFSLPEIEGEVIANAAPPNENVFEEVPASENFISEERITNGTELNNPAQVVTGPVLVNSRASENTSVENPVTTEEGVETSSGDFRVAAASPALQNANAQNMEVENPVAVEGVSEASNGNFTVVAASPALQNVRAETPVSRPEAVASPQQESVSRPETVAANPQEAPVIAASPALQNVRAETPVSRLEAVASPQQESVSRPETVAANPQEAPVIAASPALQNVRAETPVSRPEAVASPQQESVSRPETVATNPQEAPVIAASPALQNAQAQNAEAGNPVNIPAPSVDQGQGLEEGQAKTVNPEGAIVASEGASSQTASGQSNPQPTRGAQPGPLQANDLFAQETGAVNPENIRNVNELVNSVVDNEFTSEAKKIFSEPKVIRTVADLADFILERLREIIAAKQQQSQSNNGIGIS
jgi:hypothetical protein